MTTSEEYMYGALGLEKPDTFASKRVRENVKNEWPASERARQTGRTTRMLLSAIDDLIRGRKVAIVVHNLTMKRHVKDTIRTWLTQLGHPDAVDLLSVVLNEDRARGCDKVHFDHVMMGDL